MYGSVYIYALVKYKGNKKFYIRSVIHIPITPRQYKEDKEYTTNTYNNTYRT